MKIALLTGGSDRPYAFALVNALVAKNMIVDFIGSDELDEPEMLRDEKIHFLNLRGDTNPAAPLFDKLVRTVKYYSRLVKYALTTDATTFHILWADRFIFVDRVLLIGFYKLLGKKLVFTAHNVNARQRNGNDNALNRFTLSALYTLVDHIFVHTKKMKLQLNDEFNIPEDKTSIIPFGINNTLPNTDLTRQQAKARLDLDNSDKIILFFGRVIAYKGLEYAVYSLERLLKKDPSYKLVIAGQIEQGYEAYWDGVRQEIKQLGIEKNVIKEIGYIPDQDVEVFLKAADVLILPYKNIFQTGVLFLAYSFGLPVIATNVGSFNEDIVEGKTGMICIAEDTDNIAETIRVYFESNLFKNLDSTASDIVDYGNKKYSWEEVANITCSVYDELTAPKQEQSVS